MNIFSRGEIFRYFTLKSDKETGIKMHIKGYAASDIGLRRSINEDSFGFSDSDRFYLVADGMGGCAGGKIASNIVIENMKKYLSRPDGNFVSISDKLAAAIEYANKMVVRSARANPDLRDMGTTIVAALFDDNSAYLTNVGDSRIYLIRDREIKQLSTDHSLVAEMVRRNILTLEEAKTFPQKSIITKVMGMDRVPADVIQEKCYENDIFLLCTDGLTNMLEDEEIKDIILDNLNQPSKACQNLIDMANQRGGIDNVTVMIIKVSN